jgi:hypothetical protein
MHQWHWNLLSFSEITKVVSGMPINIVSDLATVMTVVDGD